MSEGNPDKKEDGAISPKFHKEGNIEKLQRQMYSRYKQPVTHPRRELSALARKTKSNWGNKFVGINPNEESSKKQKYSWQRILMLATLIIFIIAGGVTIYLFLSGSNVITARNIGVDVSGPRSISSGDILPLQIAIRNNNNVNLESVTLAITYPDGARSPGNVTSPIKTQDVSLGTVLSGGVRNGIVRAILFGQAGESKTIKVTVEYRLKGSSGIFSTNKTYTVFIASSALDIVVNTNSQAISGQTMGITVNVTSQAKIPIRGIVLKTEYPSGFVENSTTPNVGTDGMLDIGTLAPGEKRTLYITGTIDGQAGDMRVFRFIAGTKNKPSSKAIDVILASFDQEIQVERPFFGMSLTFNGKSPKEYIGEPGKSVSVVLRWKNNLNVALADVVIAASIKGIAFNPFKISIRNGFFKSINSLAMWDKTTTNGMLDTVAPGESGTVEFNLTPKETSALFSVVDPTIKIELHAAAQRLSEKSVPDSIQATVSEIIKIKTDIGLSGRSLYTENPLGSVGPLPPKVDNETTYGIMWTVSNSTNTVKNAVVSALLPPYVRWVGVMSPAAENVTFNPTSRVVTWRIGTILPNTGNGTTLPRRVVFSIGLLPSTTQVGQAPVLVQNQQFNGTDTFTKSSIIRKMGDLTTYLNEEKFADFYGRVAK